MTYPSGANTVAALITRTKTGTDDLGNAVYSETAAAVAGVWWPGGSSESVQGQDQVVWHNTICLPTGTVVEAVDVVIPQATVDGNGALVLDSDGKAQGDRFQVDGQAQPWPVSPFSGWQAAYSVVVPLTRWTG